MEKLSSKNRHDFQQPTKEGLKLGARSGAKLAFPIGLAGWIIINNGSHLVEPLTKVKTVGSIIVTVFGVSVLAGVIVRTAPVLINQLRDLGKNHK